MKDQIEQGDVDNAQKTLDSYKEFMKVSQGQSGVTAMGDVGAPGQSIASIAPPETQQNQQPIVIRQGDTINNVTNNSGGGQSTPPVGSPSRAPNPWDGMVFGNPWQAYP